MEVIHSPDVARDFAWSLRTQGKTVGLVPTMGALHDGHLSLVRISQSCCDATLATIFVNPTQFAAHEDLNKYPRTLERDCELLRGEGVSAVFVPSKESMYPEGFSTMVEPPAISRTLEGVFRPEHFAGVATIILKLFQCLPCNRAVFGRKDYQQLKVIEAMVHDLNVGVEIVAGEIIREPDGLAMSSRNQYLSETDRLRALRLSRALDAAEKQVGHGLRDTQGLQELMRTCLRADSDGHDSPAGRYDATGLGTVGVDKIDYAVVVDADSLVPLMELDRPAVALIAARVGTTRLIDNRLLIPTTG